MRLSPLALVLAIAIAALACGEGGGGSKDTKEPSGPTEVGGISVRSTQIGGSGALSMSSTATEPRIGGGSASLGQAGPVGVAGGASGQTMLAGFWHVVERLRGGADPSSEAP